MWSWTSSHRKPIWNGSKSCRFGSSRIHSFAFGSNLQSDLWVTEFMNNFIFLLTALSLSHSGKSNLSQIPTWSWTNVLSAYSVSQMNHMNYDNTPSSDCVLIQNTLEVASHWSSFKQSKKHFKKEIKRERKIHHVHTKCSGSWEKRKAGKIQSFIKITMQIIEKYTFAFRFDMEQGLFFKAIFALVNFYFFFF